MMDLGPGEVPVRLRSASTAVAAPGFLAVARVGTTLRRLPLARLREMAADRSATRSRRGVDAVDRAARREPCRAAVGASAEPAGR